MCVCVYIREALREKWRRNRGRTKFVHNSGFVIRNRPWVGIFQSFTTHLRHCRLLTALLTVSNMETWRTYTVTQNGEIEERCPRMLSVGRILRTPKCAANGEGFGERSPVNSEYAGPSTSDRDIESKSGFLRVPLKSVRVRKKCLEPLLHSSWKMYSVSAQPNFKWIRTGLGGKFEFLVPQNITSISRPSLTVILPTLRCHELDGFVIFTHYPAIQLSPTPCET